MKVLALESSSLRGSVALIVADARGHASVVGYAQYEAYNQHAERLLGLVDEALRQAGWERDQIERIAVGVGPGSFTGVRVAIATAQGLMLGLQVDGVGVGSLRALAMGWEASDLRSRIVVRDARRDEYFVAAYAADGRELLPPCTVAQSDIQSFIKQLILERPELSSHIVLGTRLDGLDCGESDETKEPDARGVGRLAVTLDPRRDLVGPCYLRGPNLIRPKLPPSPLTGPRI